MTYKSLLLTWHTSWRKTEGQHINTRNKRQNTHASAGLTVIRDLQHTTTVCELENHSQWTILERAAVVCLLPLKHISRLCCHIVFSHKYRVKRQVPCDGACGTLGDAERHKAQWSSSISFIPSRAETVTPSSVHPQSPYIYRFVILCRLL